MCRIDNKRAGKSGPTIVGCRETQGVEAGSPSTLSEVPWHSKQRETPAALESRQTFPADTLRAACKSLGEVRRTERAASVQWSSLFHRAAQGPGGDRTDGERTHRPVTRRPGPFCWHGAAFSASRAVQCLYCTGYCLCQRLNVGVD
jgi:hypothetical protein